MFRNIGKKIKTLAKVICWIGIIGGVISGLTMIAAGVAGIGVNLYDGISTNYVSAAALIVVGVMVMVVIPLLSWLSSFTLYGFGEVVDCVSDLKQSNEEMLNRVSNIAQNVYYSAQNKQQNANQQ
ncbi:MAG: hypothetical protein IJU94_02605 [Clostridia bacterium]|nr:hypothetical protein [Clostridia bacterium]